MEMSPASQASQLLCSFCDEKMRFYWQIEKKHDFQARSYLTSEYCVIERESLMISSNQ